MNSRNINYKKAFASCLGFFAFFAINGCKETEHISPDLVPGVDNVNTFGLNASDLGPFLRVRLFDSLNTSNPEVPVVGLGSLIDDPFYGNVDMGFYMQFTVPSVNYQFPDDMRSIDSARIVLPYANFIYGDSVSAVSVEVLEIDDPSFTIDTSLKRYYAVSELPVFSTIYGGTTKSLDNLNTDTLTYPNGNTYSNQFVIPLNDAFVSKFRTLAGGEFSNHYTFVNFLNGLHVRPVISDPAYRKGLHYFLLVNNSTSYYQTARLEVWYTDAENNPVSVLFPYHQTYSSFFTNVKRDYTGKPAAGYATNGHLMDSVLIQGGPGFQTDVVINNLDKIEDHSYVHLARIELNVKKSDIGIYRQPSLIMVNGVDEDGKTYNIADYQVSAIGTSQAEQVSLAQQFVGGFPVDKLIDGEEYYTYTLNFPREVQMAKNNGKTSLTLRLFPFYNYPGAFRFIAPGFYGAGNDKMKVDIIYSKP